VADDAGAMAMFARYKASHHSGTPVSKPALRIATTLVVAVLTAGAFASAAGAQLSGIHKIRHVVVLMMENRSFDSFFGTYPGATGLPRHNGHFTTCMPDPANHDCVRPYHDTSFINGGSAHGNADFITDLNGGHMNGFIQDVETPGNSSGWCGWKSTSGCMPTQNDVMGYHTAREIPNYWSLAKNFVLNDHMFEPTGSWSGTAHLFEVSQWSAKCTNGWDPSSCSTFIGTSWPLPRGNTIVLCTLSRALGVFHVPAGCTPTTQAPSPTFAWTDMTYLLHGHNVNWGYFVTPGPAPDCEGGLRSCKPTHVSVGSDNLWNPLIGFATVRQDHQLGNIQTTGQFLKLAHRGKLPSVSWVAPDQPHSDHPPADLRAGQAFVANTINTIERGPDWRSTAIFLAWDDWGGFYDNVKPPTDGGYTFGFRVPAMVISPYARRGFVDHSTMSFDAYNKFIEDDFLGGQRLDPRTDGRPDPRPNVRENLRDAGSILRDFNFSQKPRKPLILPLHPRGLPKGFHA
jgi:phospholipase C